MYKKRSSTAVTEFLQPPFSKTGMIMMLEDRASSFQLLAAPHQLSDSELKNFVVQHGDELTEAPVAVDAVAKVFTPTLRSLKWSNCLRYAFRTTAVNAAMTVRCKGEQGTNPTWNYYQEDLA